MKISFLILSSLLLGGCVATDSYKYIRVGIGIMHTDATWEGEDRTSARLGAGYVLEFGEKHLIDFNWSHISQWSLGWPKNSKAESELNSYAIDYVRKLK